MYIDLDNYKTFDEVSQIKFGCEWRHTCIHTHTDELIFSLFYSGIGRQNIFLLGSFFTATGNKPSWELPRRAFARPLLCGRGNTRRDRHWSTEYRCSHRCLMLPSSLKKPKAAHKIIPVRASYINSLMGNTHRKYVFPILNSVRL